MSDVSRLCFALCDNLMWTTLLWLTWSHVVYISEYFNCICVVLCGLLWLVNTRRVVRLEGENESGAVTYFVLPTIPLSQQFALPLLLSLCLSLCHAPEHRNTTQICSICDWVTIQCGFHRKTRETWNKYRNKSLRMGACQVYHFGVWKIWLSFFQELIIVIAENDHLAKHYYCIQQSVTEDVLNMVGLYPGDH